MVALSDLNPERRLEVKVPLDPKAVAARLSEALRAVDVKHWQASGPAAVPQGCVKRIHGYSLEPRQPLDSAPGWVRGPTVWRAFF